MDQVKLQHADECKRKIISLCFTQCESSDGRNLVRIGAYLGDFANNLRSPLNYTMRRFSESRLKPVLSADEYSRLERRQDFPWTDRRSAFDNKQLIRHIRNHHLPAYRFLEDAQPYHRGNEWLKHLMLISNKDKHVVENEILAQNAVAVFGLHADGTPHPRPSFLGDKLFVTAGKKPHVHPLPCYYAPYGAFALKEGKWSFFHIVIAETRLGLVEFLERTPKEVDSLIRGLKALI